MILTPTEVRRVVSGRKTMARIPVAYPDGIRQACPFPIGSSHAVQPAAGEPSHAQVAVTEVRSELLGAIGFDDARAEGHRTTGEFKQAWVRRHDGAWLHREKVDLAAPSGDDVVPRILTERFEQRWATTEVWVVRFWLDEERPRFLARPTRTSGDYVTNHLRSIDQDDIIGPVPVADAEYVARKTREDHAIAKAQAASFKRDLDAERFENARRAAEDAGLDTDGASRLVRRAAAALERAVDNSGGQEAA